MTTSAVPSYAGYRFSAEVISHAVWLYFHFPLRLRMLDELLAARGIVVSHETVRQWALKFGQVFANQADRGSSSKSVNGAADLRPSLSASDDDVRWFTRRIAVAMESNGCITLGGCDAEAR